MKKIIGIVVVFCLLMTFVSATTFTSTILDPGQAYLNPSVIIDSNGLGHYFWSNGQELIYTTTADISKRTTLFTAPQQLGNIYSAIGTDGTIHLVFSLYDGDYKYYYMNLNDKVAIDLNINYYENAPAIAVGQDNTLYIVLVGAQPGQEEDLVLKTSTDFETFSTTWLNKPSVQLQPSIVVDSKNVVHLAYWSWVDGIQDNIGQYKVRYTTSESNYQTEKVIALSGQSYNPVIKLDSNENVFIALKDAGESGLGFEGGYVYLYDLSTDTYEKITPGVITFQQDRPLALAIDNSDVKHVVWSELFDNRNQVSIKYANSLDFVKSTVKDVSFETDLGFVSIATFNGAPKIIANIHSIASYEEEIPPEPECNCSSLQVQIDVLKQQIEDIKERTTVLEQFMDWTKQFPLFNQFWIWTASPKECLLEQTKCESADLYNCVGYVWNKAETCAWGCSSGVCNPVPKENCQTKTNDGYYCSSGYSKYKDYYSCRYGQGTPTSCNYGQCSYSTKSTYCYGKGCNTITGKCNA